MKKWDTLENSRFIVQTTVKQTNKQMNLKSRIQFWLGLAFFVTFKKHPLPLHGLRTTRAVWAQLELTDALIYTIYNR